jgi:hypothetical protein
MQKILSIFVSTSAIAVTQLTDQFANLSNTAYVAPRQYINTVISLAERVKSAGADLSDKCIMTKIARTVDPDDIQLQAMLLLLVDSTATLDTYVTTVVETISMLKTNKTVSDLKNRREALLMTQDMSNHFHRHASYRKNVNGKSYRSNKQTRFKQNYKERFGSNAADRIRDFKKPNVISGSLVCYKCGGKGHRQKDCPSVSLSESSSTRS